MADQAFGALKEKKGFFGTAPEAAPEPPSTLHTEITTLSRRLKVLEERQDNMRRQLQFIEQNMQEAQKKLASELKASHWSLTETNKTLQEVQQDIQTLIKEIKLAARKEDVDVLKKYLQYWEPIKFLTRTQVEKLIKDTLDELGIYR